MSSMRNLFVVFEGLDGSGKSTQIDLLDAKLREAGMPTLITAEPTELPIGRLIRDVLEHRQTAHPQMVAALFAADRLAHLHDPEAGILAELKAGKTVIASRYYFSSLAYQADCADLDWIAALNQQAKTTRPADVTFFLDLPPEVSMERINANRERIDLYENLDKLTAVRKAFQRAFEYWDDATERIVKLDARRPVEAIANDIWKTVTQLMATPHPPERGDTPNQRPD